MLACPDLKCVLNGKESEGTWRKRRFQFTVVFSTVVLSTVIGGSTAALN